MFLTKTVAVREENNSGKEVTIARSTPPRNAPEMLLFLSMILRKSLNLSEAMTTIAAATGR